MKSWREKGLGVAVPSALCTLVVVTSILPFGLSATDALVAPHFLICIVYFWSIRSPAMLPAPAIFCFGLAVDLFTAGPLGFWPLICLSAHGASLLVARFVETRGWLVLCAGFVAVAAATEAVAWAVSCAYFGAWIDPAATIQAAAILCASFPLLAALFMRLVPVAPVAGRF